MNLAGFELTFHLSNSFLLLCIFKNFFYCAFFNKCCPTFHLSVVHQISPFSSIFLRESPFSSVIFLIVIIFTINLVLQQVEFRNPILYFPIGIHGFMDYSEFGLIIIVVIKLSRCIIHYVCKG